MRSKVKHVRRQVAAHAVKIQQARQNWMGKPVRFTIPQGTGFGVVYDISDDGDVVVGHEDYQTTGLPPAFAFNIERIDELLMIVL